MSTTPTMLERLKSIQAQVKELSKNRDTISRQTGIEEQKLKECYTSLRDLGVEDPESLTSSELQEMTRKSEVELDTVVAALETQLGEGNALYQEYLTKVSA